MRNGIYTHAPLFSLVADCILTDVKWLTFFLLGWFIRADSGERPHSGHSCIRRVQRQEPQHGRSQVSTPPAQRPGNTQRSVCHVTSSTHHTTCTTRWMSHTIWSDGSKTTIISGRLPASSISAWRVMRLHYENIILFSNMISMSLSAVEKELVLLGDFGSPAQSSELDILRKEKLCALIPSSQFTNISTRSPQGTRCLDNIWLSRSLKKIYSGRCAAWVCFGQW